MSQSATFPWEKSPPLSQSATFPRETSLFLGLSSRRLKVLHFLGRSMIVPLWPSHPEVSKCSISYGNLWFWDSGPLCPASESAISPWEIYNFGTLALSSRRLEVLHFLGNLASPLSKWHISQKKASLFLDLSSFPREIYDFSTLALSSRSLEVLHFPLKSLILGLWPSLPSSMILGLFPSLGLSSRSL